LRPAPALLLAIVLALPVACGARVPRSPYTFDQIQRRVAGKSAREVEALLGRPDTRQRLPTRDEKWIWWNYTVLDGKEYAPEVRRRLVHLEIFFDRRCGASNTAAPVPREAAVVSYSFPVTAP
jgi:hypothetical protein